MPRSVSGTYTLPLPPVVPNTTIEAAWANTTDDDIAQALTDSLDRYGRGGMVAPFRLVDGSVSIPAWAFSAETGTGMYRDGNGILAVSVQGAKVGQWTPLGYSGDFSGPITFDGAVDVEGQLKLHNVEEALTLIGPGAAIVWREPASQEPPGIVIGRNLSTNIVIVRGSGVSLENSVAGVQLFGNVLGPQVSTGTQLGTAVSPWGNVFCQSITSFGNVGLTGQLIVGTSNFSKIYPAVTINNGVNVGGLIDTRAKIATTGGGGMAVVTGYASSGVSFSALFTIAVRVGGGGGADVAYTQIGRSGESYPAISFVSNAGHVAFVVADAGANFATCNMYGAFDD